MAHSACFGGCLQFADSADVQVDVESGGKLIAPQQFQHAQAKNERALVEMKSGPLRVKAFSKVFCSPEFTQGVLSMMELVGLGKLQPNTVVMGYQNPIREPDDLPEVTQVRVVACFGHACPCFYFVTSVYVRPFAHWVSLDYPVTTPRTHTRTRTRAQSGGVRGYHSSNNELWLQRGHREEHEDVRLYRQAGRSH